MVHYHHIVCGLVGQYTIPHPVSGRLHELQSVHEPRPHVHWRKLSSVESTHPVWTVTVNTVHLSPLTYSVHYCADTSHAWSMQCSHHVNTHVCIGQTNYNMCRIFSTRILKVGDWHSRRAISKTCTIHWRVEGQVVQHAHNYRKCCCIVLHQEITQTSNHLITCKPQDVYTVGNLIKCLWISVIHNHNYYRLCKCTCAATTCHYTATSSTTSTDCTQHAMTTSGRPHTEYCTWS